MRFFVTLLSGLAFSMLATIQSGNAMEKSFSWTMAPGKGDNIAADLAPYRLSKYLQECLVNRPEIVAEVHDQLKSGGYYRKRTRDQKNRGTLLTVFVDRDHILHIVTFRDETCFVCNGTGTRAKPFDKMSSHVSIRLKCLKCNGEGVLKNYTNERYFTLSTEDFANPEQAREIYAQKAYANAPPEAQRWVESLASDNPQERLAACEWLDVNYVRTGLFFQDINPMLKKARFFESNEKRKMMVWQFWAGKDIPNERKRTYYRIYADSRDGKIVRKGFYAE